MNFFRPRFLWMTTFLLAMGLLAGASPARAQDDEACAAEGFYLAQLSAQFLNDGDIRLAAHLALEGMAGYPQVFSQDAYFALMNALSRSGLQTIEMTHPAGTDNAIPDFRLNADETQLLTWYEQGTIDQPNDVYAWNLGTGEARFTIPHEFPVQDARWNQDETQILSWDAAMVRVSDAATGAPSLELPIGEFVHWESLKRAAWSADESVIVTAARDLAQIWDAESGDLLAEFSHDEVPLLVNGGRKTVVDAALNDDGTRLLTRLEGQYLDYGTALQVWDVADGTMMWSHLTSAGIEGSLWSRDDSAVLMWTDEGDILVLDSATGDVLNSDQQQVATSGGELENARIDEVAFDASGAYFYTFARQRDHLMLWSLADMNAPIFAAVGVDGVVWHPELPLLLWYGQGTYADGDELVPFPPDAPPPYDYDAEGFIGQVIDASSGAVLQDFDLGDQQRWAAAFREDGTGFAIHDNTGTVEIKSLSSGLTSLTLGDAAQDMRFFDNDQRLLMTERGGIISVWDLTSGSTPRRFGGSEATRWSDDGARVLAAGRNRALIFEAESGQTITEFPYGEEGEFWQGMWSPDEGHLLAFEANEGDAAQIRVYDQRGEPLLDTFVPIETNEHGIPPLAMPAGNWHPDGEHFTVTGFDETVRVWNLDGEVVQTFPHDGLAVGAAWNADGSRLLTWSNIDGSARIWDAATGDLLESRTHGTFGVIAECDGSDNPCGPMDVPNPVLGAAWSSDGARVLSWGNGRPDPDLEGTWGVQVWGDGQWLWLPHMGNGDRARAVWGASGVRIYTYEQIEEPGQGRQTVIRIWDAASGEVLYTMQSGEIFSMRPSEDETQLFVNVVGRTDVIDLASGETVLSLRAGSPIGWNRAQTQFLTQTGLWVVDPSLLLAAARERLSGAPLTEAERERYIFGACAS